MKNAWLYISSTVSNTITDFLNSFNRCWLHASWSSSKLRKSKTIKRLQSFNWIKSYDDQFLNQNHKMSKTDVYIYHSCFVFLLKFWCPLSGKYLITASVYPKISSRACGPNEDLNLKSRHRSRFMHVVKARDLIKSTFLCVPLMCRVMQIS